MTPDEERQAEEDRELADELEQELHGTADEAAKEL